MAKHLFQKGQSGNPAGRPKKEATLTNILQRIADERSVALNGADMISAKEALARKLIQMAMGGDIQAIKYIYDRIDGTPKQTVEMEGTSEIVFPIVFKGFDDKPDE